MKHYHARILQSKISCYTWNGSTAGDRAMASNTSRPTRRSTIQGISAALLPGTGAKAADFEFTGGAGRTANASFDLETATVEDISRAMDRGALTAEQLVRLSLARVKAYEPK